MTEEKKVVFLFTKKGRLRVWKRWGERKKERWRKKHPGMVCPGGEWRAVPRGYLVNKFLASQDESQLHQLHQLVEGYLLGLRGKYMARHKGAFDVGAWKDNPLQLVLLSCLGEDVPEVLEDPTWQQDPFLVVATLLGRARVYFWSHRENQHFLVAAPDLLTAALWEIHLSLFLRVRGVVGRCTRCKGVVFGPVKLCQSCRAKPKKKVPTDRSRFLNRLSQLVRRKQLTEDHRARIKKVLDSQGLEAARQLLERCRSTQHSTK